MRGYCYQKDWNQLYSCRECMIYPLCGGEYINGPSLKDKEKFIAEHKEWWDNWKPNFGDEKN